MMAKKVIFHMGHLYILTSINLILAPEAHSGDGRSSWCTSTILDRLISFECITDGTMPNIEPAVIVNELMKAVLLSEWRCGREMV